jgi:general secretion pathway protein G
MRNAFSLLELLICVSIILVLATVAVPKFSSAGKNAKIAKVQTDIRTISNAAALYEAENGKYPSNVAALVSADVNGNSYLQFEPKLPDKTDYKIDDKTGIVTASYDGVTYDSQKLSPPTKTDSGT